VEEPTSRSPSLSADHAAEVAPLEGRVLVRKNVSLAVAECRVRLALDAVVKGAKQDVVSQLRGRFRDFARAFQMKSAFCVSSEITLASGETRG
jgi:hypothetical protein